MTPWLLRTLTNAVAVAAATWLFHGITITGADDGSRLLTLLVVALLFGLVNEVVRPVVAFLSFPLYLVTLGLMFFVVNALMLLLTSWVCDKIDVGFAVDGFATALGGALVISVVSWLVGLALPDRARRRR